MPNICIYASDLAVITGHNKYQDISEIIIKLWKRNFPQDYSSIISEISKELNVAFIEESPEEYLKRISKTHNIQDITEKLNNCLDTTDVLDLNVKQKELVKTFEKLPKKEKKMVEECITKKTNTNFGTKHENIAVKKYMEQTGDEVKLVEKFFKKDIFKTKNNNVWSIGGKIDGINKDNVLIEIKNRVKRLFYKLRDYEKIQVYAYMNILNLDNAKLVENYKTNNNCDINIIDISYNSDYWETEIESKLGKFIKQFEKLMNDKSKKIELITKLCTSLS